MSGRLPRGVHAWVTTFNRVTRSVQGSVKARKRQKCSSKRQRSLRRNCDHIGEPVLVDAQPARAQE
jgi:hypothetical protein